MSVVYLIIGLAAGFLLGWLIAASRLSKEKNAMAQNVSALAKEIDLLKASARETSEEKNLLRQQIDSGQQVVQDLKSRLAAAAVEQANLKEKLENQKKEMEEVQKKLTLEFENIANRLLRQNSQEFSQVNQKSIGDIVNPLKEKIAQFEKKVEDTYEKNVKDSVDLRAELRNLKDLNQRISEEASHLTKALRSDTKKMGNWGEFILDRILEQSGLVKGKEYDSQPSVRDEDGSMLRPDVIIRLPENKHLIIDSKVSLIAYDRFVNAEDDKLREPFLKSHLDSVRDHIKGLAEKSYQKVPGLDVPDFVLLFMPLESAFSLAVQNDPDLFSFAWDRKIVLVSPSTLLATLRTVSAIWKHEKQTQNALEIARLGGSLYDKFQGFISDLENVGGQIDKLSSTYEDAKKKLFTGKGNLVSKAEKLKELGVKTEKAMNQKFITEEHADEE